MDMMKLMVAFRNFANVLNNYVIINIRVMKTFNTIRLQNVLLTLNSVS
jgi:hypothetical protein